MIDWAKRQRDCTNCRGWGFTRSVDGKSATRCRCQPWTMDELAEAAAQEQAEAVMSEWKPPDASVAWQPLHLAPRDRPIRLFLPTAKYESSGEGRPSDVESAECVGVWDEAQQHFVDRDTRQKVYASQWAELS